MRVQSIMLVLALCAIAAGQSAPATPAPKAKPISLAQRAWTLLDEGAHDKGADKRARAVRVLGLVPRDTRAANLAIGALADPNPGVRAAAASALGQMRAVAAVPKLRAALDDKESSVVLAAASALLELGDRSGYEVYYTILTGQRRPGKGLVAEQTAMLKDPKHMAQFGFEEGIGFVPFASMGYEAVKVLTKDDLSPLRAAAARELAKDSDERSAAALVEATKDKHWLVRAAALDAIARRGDRRLLPQLEPVLTDGKDVVQYTAAAAILRLSHTRAATTSAAQ